MLGTSNIATHIGRSRKLNIQVTVRIEETLGARELFFTIIHSKYSQTIYSKETFLILSIFYHPHYSSISSIEFCIA